MFDIARKYRKIGVVYHDTFNTLYIYIYIVITNNVVTCTSDKEKCGNTTQKFTVVFRVIGFLSFEGNSVNIHRTGEAKQLIFQFGIEKVKLTSHFRLFHRMATLFSSLLMIF